MNPRTTGIAFLVAAALAAFLYFYQVRVVPESMKAEEAAKRLFPTLEETEIDWIALTTRDGQPARAERREGRWRLVSPLNFPGDEFALDGMASTLAQMASETTFDHPQPPEVYGLDNDDREVRFGAGDAEFALRSGNKTPVGSNTYVSVSGSEAVYAVPSYRVSALSKDLDELRDKRVLRFDTSAIDRVAAHWPGGGVTVERGEDGWRVVEPLQGPADVTAIDALLADLSFLRATGFVDDPPPDRKLGLAKPAFQVELSGAAAAEGAEPLRLEMAIGETVDDNSRIVRAGGKTRYRIPAERLTDFPRKVVAYRFRQLSSFPGSDARRVEIVFAPAPGQPVSAEPVTVIATRDDAGWTSSPESFRPGALARLVSDLSRLRAVEIVAESAGPDELRGLQLDPPAAAYRVFDAAEGGEPIARVDLGRIQADGSVLARSGDGETVYGLDPAVSEHLPVSLEAFRNRFASQGEETPQAGGADAADFPDAQDLRDEDDAGS